MMIRMIVTAMILAVLICGPLGADTLDQARETVTETNRTLASTQETINRADDKTQAMAARYKTLTREIGNYKVYNSQLKDIVASQRREMETLEKNIKTAETAGRSMMPFMQRLIDGLDSFIKSDLPFLPAERQERLSKLKAAMKRSDITMAAKFRQILEAYQVEIDYGNTLEAYDGELDGKQVHFFRLGRIGLYAASMDHSRFFAWHKGNGAWRSLGGAEYKRSLTKALKIAKKQMAPELFIAAVPPVKDRK